MHRTLIFDTLIESKTQKKILGFTDYFLQPLQSNVFKV